jgi:phosphate transport system substrate-binding protein
MNDNFLYDLRSPPSPQFAARLKARLDLQASETRQKRRAFKWFVFGAILMGGTALAFVSPSVRQAAWTMVVQFRGSPAQGEGVQSIPTRAPSSSGPLRTAADPSEQEQDLERSGGNAASASVGPRDVQPPAEAQPSVQSTSAPAVSADGRETVVAGAATRRTTVTIAHVKSVGLLAANLASDLEDRLRTIRYATVERPGATSCASDFQSTTMDLLITDERLSEEARAGCSPRSEIVEVKLAYQAIALVIHRENQWARVIALEDLEKFRTEHHSSPFTTWSQLRADWPTIPIRLAGDAKSAAVRRFIRASGLPGTGSRLGQMVSDRATMEWVEVVSEANVIGFVEWRSLQEMHKLHSEWPIAASITRGNGAPVAPTAATISEGSYPLAEPIWIYVDARRLNQFGIWSALEQLLARGLAVKAIERSGFVSVGPDDRESAMRLLKEARTHASQQ